MEIYDWYRAKYTRGLEDEERGDIKNNEDGKYVARKDIEDIEDIDSVEDIVEEEEKDSVDENKGENDKDKEKDDEDKENSDSILADEVNTLYSNWLNEYIKEKHT